MLKHLLGAGGALLILCASFGLCASFAPVLAEASQTVSAAYVDQSAHQLSFLPRTNASHRPTPAMQLAKHKCAGLGDPCSSSKPCCSGMVCKPGHAEGKAGAWCDNQ